MINFVVTSIMVHYIFVENNNSKHMQDKDYSQPFFKTKRASIENDVINALKLEKEKTKHIKLIN